MELINLKIENFKLHSLSDVNFESLQTAIVVAKSENNEDESNGCGKSTFFEAIEYVLFGEYHAGTVDKVVKLGTDRAVVTIDFKENNKFYRIERSRNKKSKKSDLKIWEKIGDELISKNQKTPTENEELVKRIVKISYPAFRNSVLFSQGDLQGIASAKDPDKRMGLLKDALSLLDYSKLEKISKEVTVDCNKKIVLCRESINELGNPEEEIISLEKDLSNLEIEINKNQENSSKTQNELVNLKSSLLENRKTLSGSSSDLSIRISENQTKLNNLIKNNIEIQNKINKKTFEYDSINKKINDKKQEIINNNSLINSINLKNNREIEVIQGELDKNIKNEQNGKIYISTLQSKIDDLKIPVPAGDSCKSCRREMDEDHRQHVLKENAIKLEEFEQDLNKKSSLLKQIVAKQRTLREELQSTKLNQSKIIELNQSNYSLEKEIPLYEGMINPITESIQEFNNEIFKNKSIELTIQKDIETLNEQTKSFNIESLSQKIQKIESDIESKDKENKDILVKLSSLNTQKGMLSERKSRRFIDLNILAERKNLLKKLESELKINQLVVEGYSPSGIPSMIIHTILDDLQEETNKFLSQLQARLSANFTPELDIIFKVGSNEFDYDQLSGGQKMMVALAFRLALAIVLQKHLNLFINFIILDEVDEKLDPASSAAFSNIVKFLQSEYGFKVFVITHNDRLKSKFKQAIVINNNSDGSTARVVTSW